MSGCTAIPGPPEQLLSWPPSCSFSPCIESLHFLLSPGEHKVEVETEVEAEVQVETEVEAEARAEVAGTVPCNHNCSPLLERTQSQVRGVTRSEAEHEGAVESRSHTLVWFVN